MALERLTTKSITRTIAVPGTPEALTTDTTIIVIDVGLKARKTNTGQFRIGDATSAVYSIDPGEAFQFSDYFSAIKQKDIEITPTGIFIDADNNTDVLEVVFVDVVRIA